MFKTETLIVKNGVKSLNVWLKYFLKEPTAGSTKVLEPTDHQKTRHVSHIGLSPQRREINACFAPRGLGVTVVNDLVTFAICGVRPYPNPLNAYLGLFLS